MNKNLIHISRQSNIFPLFANIAILLVISSCSQLGNNNKSDANNNIESNSAYTIFNDSKFNPPNYLGSGQEVIQAKQQVGSILSDEEDVRKEIKTIDNKLIEITKAIRNAGEPAITFWASDMFLKASWASLNGDVYAAMILLKNLHQLKPEDTFIAKRYAIELIKIGKIADAKTILEAIMKNSNTFKGNKIDERTMLLMAGVYTAMAKKNQAR